MPTRREFLLNGSALAASLALAPATALSARPCLRPRDVCLDDLSAAMFAPHLQTCFLVRDQAGATVELQLAAIELLESSAAVDRSAGGESMESFSLVFMGDAETSLRQNIYGFEHAVIGRFEMFIVPVGRPGHRSRRYEAVFNRSAPELRPEGRGASGPFLGKIPARERKESHG